MRDLFQVVFALKRKEIEVAKQNLDKNRFGASSIFPDNSISNVLNKVHNHCHFCKRPFDGFV